MLEIIPVILSGGVGSRLWPLSREHYPKQCLSLDGNSGHTLLQQTLLRVPERLPGASLARPIVVCNEEQRFLVAEQLRQIDAKPSAIILEPEGRNTAPAAVLAALKATQSGEDPLLLVMPADHAIESNKVFEESLIKGKRLVESGAPVAFGVPATSAHTGYGYIRAGDAVDGGFRIDEFIEKPDRDLAQQLKDQGALWNCGVFMFRASWFLEAVGRYSPEVLRCVKRAFEEGQDDLDFFRPNANRFLKCPSDSIDYAVMENVFGACVVPLSTSWRDLGSWQSLWEVGDADENGNSVQGDVHLSGVSGTLVRAESRLVALLGVEDQVVVETADAVLVADRSQVGQLSDLVAELKRAGRTEAVEHQVVYRPWGNYQRLVRGQGYLVKRILINPGQSISLQRHSRRAEHWVVVSGCGTVTCADRQFQLSANQSTFIPKGTVHQLKNTGDALLELIEVQSGDYLAEDDIERLEDQYGRKVIR